MKLHFQKMQNFMGIMRNLDLTEMPFGMAFTCQNMAQYTYGRLQRIAGLTIPPQITGIDASQRISLGAFIREVVTNGSSFPLAVYSGNINKLTANQSSVETDTGGFFAVLGTETLTKDCTTAQFGTCSLKVVTPATAGAGVMTNATVAPRTFSVAVTPGTTYTFTTFFKQTTGSTSTVFAINWYDGNGVLLSTSTTTSTTAALFARYTVTAAAPTNAATAGVSVTNAFATASTFWIDGLQFEAAAVASAWTSGGIVNSIPVNIATPAAMTGPALTSLQFDNWSYAFYAQQHLIASDQNAIQQVTAVGTYAAWTPTGSFPAKGGLIRSFLDRLYWAGDQTNASNEGIVYYTDALTNNFSSSGFVNVKELPGPVTALGVYEPSTGATAGATGIKGGLLIFKQAGIWYWDESSKDLISGKIGTRSPHTVQNSPVGTIFLGMRGSQYSVFVIPPGYYGYIHFGEPIDVGKPLFTLLNSYSSVTWQNASGVTVPWQNTLHTVVPWSVSSGVTQPINAHAVIDGKFYKLFVSIGTDNQNQTELWLDLDALTQSPGETRGGNPPAVVWYGPHQRGKFDNNILSDSNGLYLLQRGETNTNVAFLENQDISQGFLDTNGNVLLAYLDLAVNFEPMESEKIYDLSEIHLAPESNQTGVYLAYNFLADHVSQGQGSAQPTMTPDGVAVNHIEIPLYSPGRTGTAAHHGELQLSFPLNQRLDLIGMTVQFLAMDQLKIVPHVRT